MFGMVGHALCVPCYLACLIAPSALTFALAIALSGFFNDLAMGSAWSVCQDVGKKHAAIVAGCMNTVGNLGGAAGAYSPARSSAWTRDSYFLAHGLNLDALKADPSQSGVLKDALKAGLLPGYNLNFLIYAAIYVIAVLLWLGVDATKPVLPEDAAVPPAEAAGETSIPAD